MKTIVESLKRLYISGEITEDKIIDMCLKGTLDQKEKEYILRKEE